MIKKFFRHHWRPTVLLVVAATLLYLVLGFALSSAIHPNVSQNFKESFSAESCYGDGSSGTERVLCIDDNMDALIWRLRVIENAQEEIIFSTFDLKEDESGLAIMSVLWEAAERGVHIRMIVDGMHGLLDLSDSDAFKTLAAHPNVEAKFYNAINLLKSWKLSFRLHDKYLIADDTVYILGGRNTYDLFLEEAAERGNIDRDLLVYETEPGIDDCSLTQVKNYFETVWAGSFNKEVDGFINGEKISEETAVLEQEYSEIREKYLYAFEETDYESATVAADKITLLVNPIEPSSKAPELWYMLCKLMEGKEDVLIQTPYIICNKMMYNDLTEVCSFSENVRILINAVENGANPWGCMDYLNQKEKISGTGAAICEFIGDNSMHTKTILIDDNISIVGSYNFDMRSAYLDTEMMLVVDCKELNAELRETSEREMLQCKMVYPDGTEEYGEKFTPVEMTLEKRMAYSAGRVIIMPFRYLL